MKLLLAVVQDVDAAGLERALIRGGLQATKLASTGGFLRQGNTTFLIGLEDHETDRAVAIVKESCHSRTRVVNTLPPLAEQADLSMQAPVEVTVGGATIFVLAVEDLLKV